MLPVRHFADLGLCAPLLTRLRELGYDTPSHAQSLCIPALLAGCDLLAYLHTGTGRTLAFALAVLHTLRLDEAVPQAAILTPDDHTALHVAEVLQSHAHYLPDFHVLPIYHEGAAVQSRQMRRGTHVVTGTPRRLQHHVEEHGLDLSQVAFVVLDEADEMLRREFDGDIHWVLQRMATPRTTALFASRPSKELTRLIRDTLRKPLIVTDNESSILPSAIRLRHWPVSPRGKLEALTRLIEIEPEFDAALVFVHDPGRAAALTEKLCARGYAAAVLGHGQPEALAAGEIDILICTDDDAPGRPLPRITHIVSYDMPCDVATHAIRLTHIAPQHRMHAVLLVPPHDIGLLRNLEHAIGHPIPEIELPERHR